MGVSAGNKMRVTARDRKGRRLLLPALRATYDKATAAIPHRPPLPLEPSTRSDGGAGDGAEAVAQLAVKRGSTAFAALLKGLLEVSRRHRDVELELDMTGDRADGVAADEPVRISRGVFERDSPALENLVQRLRVTRTDQASELASEAPPRPGAERIGHLQGLRELLAGRPFALAYAGSIYVPDGPETARRVTPPGRFGAACWDPAAVSLAVLGRAEGANLALWLCTRGSSVRVVQAIESIKGDPTGAAFSPDGGSLAVTMTAGRLAVLPADGSSAAFIQVARGAKLLEPTWAPDGKSLACLVEEASRARTLMLVSVEEGKKGARLFAVDAPAEDELALADPTFSADGAWIWVRALWGKKGEPRQPRLVRVPTSTGAAEPLPLPLRHVKPSGMPSCLRDGRLFVGGIADAPDAPVSAAWIDPPALAPDQPQPPLVSAPGGARVSAAGPDGSILFVRRTVRSTKVHRVERDGTVRKIRLPFSAWLTLP